MPITFDEKRKLFHLFNKNISYYFYIHDSKMLVSLYFGKRLDFMDIDAISYESNDWYQCFYNHQTGKEEAFQNLWVNSSSFLTPSYGLGDSRNAFIKFECETNNKVDFRYVSHSIYKGKPVLSNLPYIRDSNKNAETVEIKLKDYTKDVYLVLSLSIFDDLDVITRNSKIINEEKSSLWLDKAMSISQDFPKKDFDLIHFSGEWAYERQLRREALVEGSKKLEAIAGRSSHEENPFCFLVNKDTNEDYGDVYGFSFLYSSSFECVANVSKTGVTRLSFGIAEEHFKYEVKSKEEFVFPEGIMSYSSNGLTSASHTIHTLVKEHLIDEASKETYNSILLNSWEGCYFDFDTAKIVDYIQSAKKFGAELFVLDDGWFGHRNDDSNSLGDWFVNKDKIDLGKVINECHKNKMKFGIWFEPEMGSIDSKLIKEHPNYLGVDLKMDPYISRHEFFLNFADEEVVNNIYEQMKAILDVYPIDYIKWDHNRLLESFYAQNLDNQHQGEFYHRNILGYYRLISLLRARYPHIHFQGCASGGGRFDLGTLFYFSEVWTSDENDPIQRLFIQYSTSFMYPPSVMGTHINNHPITSYKTKAEIALFGSYGFELDPRKLNEKEIAEIEEINKIYHQYHQDVVLDGDLYRLINPFDHKAFAINMVNKKKSAALFLFVNLLKQPRERRYIKLKGLDPLKMYKNSYDNHVLSGAYYMNVGINLTTWLNEFDSYLIVLDEVKNA